MLTLLFFHMMKCLCPSHLTHFLYRMDEDYIHRERVPEFDTIQVRTFVCFIQAPAKVVTATPFLPEQIARTMA